MKRILAVSVILAFLMPCAQAEYYTSNEDRYYHESNICISGSEYPISEEAAWQFHKVACPNCTDRQAVEGEIITLSVPEDFHLYSADMDAEGRVLMAGYTDTPSNKSSYIAQLSSAGELIWEQKNISDGLFFRDANLLPDGSIAALRQANGSESDNWQIQVAADGKITVKMPVLQDISCLESSGDGILVVNRASTQECQLLKYDLNGNELWNTSLDGFYQMKLLIGDDMHLAYGSRAIDAEDYQGDHIAHAVLVDDDGSVLCRIEDADIGSYSCAAWTPDGSIVLYSRKYRPGAIMKYNQNGEEIWRHDLGDLCGENAQILVNASPVRCLEVADMFSREDGLLLALLTDSGFVRLIQLDDNGYVKRDWIETIGDFAWVDSLHLFERNHIMYMIAGGGTMDQTVAFDSGMTLADIPMKYTLKKPDTDWSVP